MWYWTALERSSQHGGKEVASGKEMGHTVEIVEGWIAGQELGLEVEFLGGVGGGALSGGEGGREKAGDDAGKLHG